MVRPVMAAAIVANLGLRSMPLSVDCTEILVVYADKSTIADMMDDVVFLRMDEGGLSYYEERMSEADAMVVVVFGALDLRA